MDITKIKNSRGEDTVQINYKGAVGSAPGGKSKGIYEVKDFNSDIDTEINLLREMSGTLENIQVNSFDDFRKIENIASKLGGTVMTALEFAIFNYKGGYKFLEGRKLPRPLGNVIGGGMHKDNSTLDFQEFLIIPYKVKTFNEAVEKNLKFYRKMHDKIKELDKNFEDAITDEGAWSPSLDNERVLKLLKKHVGGFGLKIGVDMAASSFFKNASESFISILKSWPNALKSSFLSIFPCIIPFKTIWASSRSFGAFSFAFLNSWAAS